MENENLVHCLIKAVAYEVRQNRKVELNLSQREYAERCNISSRTVMGIEGEKIEDLNIKTIAGLAVGSGQPLKFLRSVIERVEEMAMDL